MTPKLTVGRKVWFIYLGTESPTTGFYKPSKVKVLYYPRDRGERIPKWAFSTRQEAQAACAKLREALRGARVIK